MEAIKIHIEGGSGGVRYKTHLSNIGWVDESRDGEISGTVGEDRAIEAVQIQLYGDISEKYDIYYRVHVEQEGWLGWAYNGETAGTTGGNMRVEAIQIQLIPKVVYSAHVQYQGWQDPVSSGQTAGTEGENLRMEAIMIETPYEGLDIKYRAYVQDYGWMEEVKNGARAGTVEEDRRMEAIEITLSGYGYSRYSIYYRVHVEDYGWMDWVKSGATAGTMDESRRIEAIQIRIVPNGMDIEAAAWIDYDAEVDKVDKMQSIIDRIGWQTLDQYPNSNKMCSAFSMAYARAYMYDDFTPPIAYWNGTAYWTWGNMTPSDCNSEDEFYDCIDNELDAGTVCIIRVYGGGSDEHYVTVIGYTEDGDLLVAEPWNGVVAALSNTQFHVDEREYKIIRFN